MANRYWVGGTASWDGTAGTKWSATSGGSGGASVPTTADDVFFDNAIAGSNGTVTIATGNTGAKSITCTGFIGTLTGTAAITVAGSITLVAGMTYTHTGTVTISGTGTLTTAGKTFSTVTVNGSGITVTLGDALNTSTRGVTVTQGTFDTGGFNVTSGFLSSNNSNTRTINLNNSTLTFSSVTGVFFSTSTNLTFNAGTSQINLSSASANLDGGGMTFYNVSLTSTSSLANRVVSGVNTFNDLSVTAPGVPSGIGELQLSNNQTINGTFTCAGATAVRRIFVRSDTIGTTRTLTVATLSANDCDFRDITIAGAAAGGSPTRAGDCKGNSGITFPAAKTVYWNLAAGGNWSATGWAASSGASPAINNFPLAQDTAIIEATGLNSGTTLTIETRWSIGSIDLSARTANTVTLASSTVQVQYYGDYKLGSGVTITGTGTSTFAGRTTQNITSAGRTITFPITVNVTNTNFKLLDAVTTSNTITFTAGTIDCNLYTLTCTTFDSNNANTRTLSFGTGNITVTSTGAVWNTGITNLTVTGTPVVNVTNSTATATTVTPGLASEANLISFNFTAGTYTLTLTGYVRSLDFTGFAGTLSNSAARRVYGDLIISTGMTLTAGANALTFSSTNGTARNINSGGKTFDFPVSFDGVGGTWKLLTNNLTLGSTRILTHINGTIDLNGLTLNSGLSYATASGTKNLTFNGGTLVCPAATSTAFDNGNPANFTTTAGTGTGKISMTAATAKTFVGGSRTYNCTLSNDGAGTLTITGSNTFTTLANGVQPTTFSFTAGTTTTLTNWSISGTAGNLVTIQSATAASHTLSKASGTVSADYLSISRSTATGGASWYAGANSTDGGNNSGWLFTAPQNFVDGQAIIDAIADLSIAATRIQNSPVLIDGVADFAISGVRIQSSPVLIDGVAEISVAANRVQFGAVLIDGVAALSVSGTRIQSSPILINGVSDLSVSAVGVFSGSTTISGVADLTPSALAIFTSSVAIDGAGALVISGNRVQNFAASIDASGAVEISAVLKWSQVPDGTEIWTQATDSATIWTPVATGSETWTRVQ